MKIEGKRAVQVVIGGKIFTMGGYEDENHIHRIASCVNHTIEELSETEMYQSLTADLKPILIEINIADELVKAQDTISELQEDLRLKEAENSEIKQALAEAQVKLDRLGKHGK